MMMLTLLIAGVFEILFPFIFACWFLRRTNLSWKLIEVGALTFILSQVGHIPFLLWLTNLFNTGILPAPPEKWTLIFNAVILGFLAGLFEETARAIAYILVKDARSWNDGVLMGIGHGGIEAVFVGVTVLSSLALWFASRLNVPGLYTPQMQSAAVSLNSISWDLPLASAVERLCSLTLHLSFSLLVLQAFIQHQIGYYLLAIIWHTFVDSVTVWLAGTGMSACPLEMIILLFATAAIGISIKLKPVQSSPLVGNMPNN